MSEFIPYIGGKTYLADKIIKLVPKHLTYTEVFCGSATVFFHKAPSKVEVLNDINRELVTLFRVVQNHPDEFVKSFELMLVSRDEFERQKKLDPDTLTDIQRAVRFFYLQRTAFGGKVVGQSFGTSVTNPARLTYEALQEIIFEVRYRLAKVTIECLPYELFMQKYDRTETLFYLDPPYYNTEKFYGKDVFSKDDFGRIAEILNAIKGKFILSINDTPEIRKIFTAFNQREIADVQYTVGLNNNHTAAELIYTNF